MTKAEPIGLDLGALVAAAQVDFGALLVDMSDADRAMVAAFTGETAFPARALRRGEDPETAALVDAERARRRGRNWPDRRSST